MSLVAASNVQIASLPLLVDLVPWLKTLLELLEIERFFDNTVF
jgi:hypothetical protein